MEAKFRESPRLQMPAASVLLLFEASRVSTGKASVVIDSGIVVAVCFILFAETGSLTGEAGSLGPLPDEIPAGLETEAPPSTR